MVLPTEFILAVEIDGGDGEELCRLGGGGDAGAPVIEAGDLDVGEPGLVGGEGVPDDGGKGLEVVRGRAVFGVETCFELSAGSAGRC